MSRDDRTMPGEDTRCSSRACSPASHPGTQSISHPLPHSPPLPVPDPSADSDDVSPSLLPPVLSDQGEQEPDEEEAEGGAALSGGDGVEDDCFPSATSNVTSASSTASPAEAVHHALPHIPDRHLEVAETSGSTDTAAVGAVGTGGLVTQLTDSRDHGSSDGEAGTPPGSSSPSGDSDKAGEQRSVEPDSPPAGTVASAAAETAGGAAVPSQQESASLDGADSSASAPSKTHELRSRDKQGKSPSTSARAANLTGSVGQKRSDVPPRALRSSSVTSHSGRSLSQPSIVDSFNRKGQSGTMNKSDGGKGAGRESREPKARSNSTKR